MPTVAQIYYYMSGLISNVSMFSCDLYDRDVHDDYNHNTIIMMIIIMIIIKVLWTDGFLA